jgi:hypothetical protein
VGDRGPQAVERLILVQVRVDQTCPAGGRRRRHRPVRRRPVDDVADVRQVGQDVTARASRLDAVQRVRRHVSGERDPRRVLVRQPFEPVDHPRRDEVQGRLVGEGEPLPLHPRVEDDNVDPARTALVRGTRDLAGDRLLTGVRRDADDLPGLDVRPEADDQVREPSRQVGHVAHGAGP